MANQRHSFGPWSSSLDSGTRLELSAFWRRRMAGLARLPLGRRVSRRWTAVGVLASLLLAATPLVDLSPQAVADEEPAANKQKSVAVKSDEFVWRFSNGLEVELIGLAKNPSKDQSWWQPDGTPLENVSLPAAKFISEGGAAREIAFRWRNVPDDPDQSRTWHTVPQYGGAGGSVTDVESNGSILQVVGAAFDGNPQEITVTFTASVSATPWKTAFESDGRNPISAGRAVDGKILSVAFAPAFETKTGVAITVSYGVDGQTARVIAIDKAGQEHLASRQRGVGSTHFDQTTFEFDDLARKDIERFELQTQSRTMETVEFRNVSLDADHATKVKVTPAGDGPIDDDETLLSIMRQNRPKAGEKFDRTPILGPITSGTLVTLNPPTDEEVLRAYEKSRPIGRSAQREEEFNRQVERVEKKLISESVDPARVYPLVGPAKHIHAYYHCILHLKGGATHEIYVDHNHLHMIGADGGEDREKVKDAELKFGEVVERFVKDDNPEVGDFLIDFETGKVFSPPADLAQDKIMEWVKENGVDAMGEMKSSVQGLMGFDMIVIPVNEANWNPSPGIFAQLDQGKPGTPAVMSGRGDLPATFHFQTGGGTRGVMQIVEVVAHEGVKIRYKLAKK